MNAVGLNVDAVADGVCLLFGLRVLGVRDGQLAGDDQMRCQASVGMRLVVGVAAY